MAVRGRYMLNAMAPRGGSNEKFWRGEMTAAMPVARRASGWNVV